MMVEESDGFHLKISTIFVPSANQCSISTNQTNLFMLSIASMYALYIIYLFLRYLYNGAPPQNRTASSCSSDRRTHQLYQRSSLQSGNWRCQPTYRDGVDWCRKLDLNQRPVAYEANALPLSYIGSYSDCSAACAA